MKKNENEKVTVIIPVYNQDKYISTAIDSVLKQTYKNFEILVINDGSTDNTEEILKNYGSKITYVNQKNQGTSVAWNRAIEIADTKYVIGLDSDDEFKPNTVEETIKKALEFPKADLIYSDYEFINENGDTTKVVKNPEPLNPIEQLIKLHDNLGQPNNFLPFGHVRLYKRKVLLELNGYDKRFLYADDFDLVLRFAEHKYIFIHVPKVLYRYRWHTTNKGVVTRKEQVLDVKQAVIEFKQRNGYE